MNKDELSYKVIDNFLPYVDANSLHFNLLEDPNFPWFLVNGVLVEKDEYYKNDFQFVHSFLYENGAKGPFYNYIAPLLLALNPKKVYRIKANLNPIADSIFEHGYHVDFPDLNIKTAVYYVNSNNGYTKFKDGDIVESVANRVLIFDSQMQHTGSTCTDKNYRCVININYE